MESATKPVKPSTNISNIIHRFAKVCRSRSIGVFSNENPSHHHHHLNTKNASSTDNSSIDAAEGTECFVQRIHPQPVKEALTKAHEDLAVTVILELFDTISALKLAYIKLQEAHIPYNPAKIQAADDVVVSELKTLCDIKRSYKHVSKPKSVSSLSGPLLREGIQDHAGQLEKLQSQMQSKDYEILLLQQELEELDMENAELEAKIKQRALEEENAWVCKDLSPCSFYEVFKAATKSIHDFAKPLISLMKASGCDLDKAVSSIEHSIVYSKRSHKKYAFEAYISRRMFHGFCLEFHNVDDIFRYRDPFDALIENPNSDFAKFCRSKYLLVVHAKMEALFFGNLDQRAFVLSGRHPRTPFYEVFVKMSKCVWVLQAMAALTEPKAEIFAVERGSEFSEAYMECVVDDDDDDNTLKSNSVSNSKGRYRIGFMVMPGFRIGPTVIRSRVYLSPM